LLLPFVTFSALGFLLVFMVRKHNVEGKLKKSLDLAGYSAGFILVGVVLHNLASALGILLLKKEIEEPVFFILATVILPLLFIVGSTKTVLTTKKVFPVAAALLFVVLFLSYGIGEKSDNPKLENTIAESNDGFYEDWNTYKSDDLGIELKYPNKYFVEEDDNTIGVFSPRYLCRAAGSEDAYQEMSEVSIQMIIHRGKSFERTWQDIFDFKFTGKEDSIDGIKIIDGRKAYYFYQGAELSFGRQAFLIDLGEGKLLEINVYEPSYTFECEGWDGAFTNDGDYVLAADQIISSIIFLD